VAVDRPYYNVDSYAFEEEGNLSWVVTLGSGANQHTYYYQLASTAWSSTSSMPAASTIRDSSAPAGAGLTT